MIPRNTVFKFGLAAVVLSGVGIGFWSMSEPSVAVNKSPVPAHKCCSTWEDHMRASGVDDEVGKAFELKPVLTDVPPSFPVDQRYFVIRH